MTKITLPEPVKCWKCRGTTFIHDPDRDDPIPCDCKTGFRYDFDAVAAAVAKARLGYNVCSFDEEPGTDHAANIMDLRVHPPGNVVGEGPTPTAALVAAAVKVNEGG